MGLAKVSACLAVVQLQPRLDFLGQENDTFFEVPVGCILFPVNAIEVGAYFDIGELFQGIVVEKEDLIVAANAIVSTIQIFVEYVRRRVVFLCSAPGY